MGGATGDPSALLDLQSVSKGLLIPRMTSIQRSAIVNPAAGLLIYNTTQQCVEINAGSRSSPDWACLLGGEGTCQTLDCAAATWSDSLITGFAVGTTVTIPYTGGDGKPFKGQVFSSTGVTGLAANLMPGIFAGGSGSITYNIVGRPTTAGTASFALGVGGQACNLDIPVINACGAYIATGVWKEFQCHNLGANITADPFLPGWELIGNYYQWGRNPTCFGRDGSDSANTCSSPVQGAMAPWGNTTSNDNAGSITGWDTATASDNAWQDAVKTANDPCPGGFRIPTLVQWEGVANRTLNSHRFVGAWNGSSTNYSSGVKIGGALFLPAAGIRNSSGGWLFSRGQNGNYWTSTAVSGSTRAHYLRLGNGGVFIASEDTRLTGSSLRCIAE